MHNPLIALQDVSVHYGGVQALSHVTIEIEEGETVALMGPNGAGKSTVLKALFGLAPLESGEVRWRGERIVPKPHEMAGRGIAYVPQGRQVFKNLSVGENLELGAYTLGNAGRMGENLESVLAFFPALRGKLFEKAGDLSGGQQQMLTIARGLMSNPSVLLLDEPSLGLSPKIVKGVFEKVADIAHERKVAIVIVEHSIASALGVAKRAYVLSQGKIALHGTSGTISHESLERVFLGQASQ